MTHTETHNLPGQVNPNGLMLVKKNLGRSDKHAYAQNWAVICTECFNVAVINSCDYHLRLCPTCSGGEPAND